MLQMSATSPILIYAPAFAPRPATKTERLLAMLFTSIALTVSVIAMRLSPSPTGTATHTQLGLSSCAFLDTYGLPCPGCGMTTSFAWFVRGNIVASLYVQPMGCLLALLTTATILIGGYIAITGVPLHRVFLLVASRYYLFAFFAIGMIGWGWKMYVVVRGIDGWR